MSVDDSDSDCEPWIVDHPWTVDHIVYDLRSVTEWACGVPYGTIGVTAAVYGAPAAPPVNDHNISIVRRHAYMMGLSTYINSFSRLMS